MISVVIPVVNRRETLQRAAQSVMQQTGIDRDRIELIVVDDGSSPPISADILPPGTRIVRIGVNKGPAAARNAGVAVAKNKLIAFLDSDDIWLPDKLASQLEYYTGRCAGMDPARTAVVSGFYYYNNRSHRIEARIPRASSDPIDFAGGCWFCPGSTLLVDRKAFERTGGFDERLRRLEDVDWFLRFSLLGGAIVVAPTAGALIRPSGSVGNAALSQPLGLLEEKFLYEPEGLKLEGAMRRTFVAYCDLERCASALVDGRRFRAIAFLFRSLLLSPRLRPALRPYWTDHGKVPAEIRDLATRSSDPLVASGRID